MSTTRMVIAHVAILWAMSEIEQFTCVLPKGKARENTGLDGGDNDVATSDVLHMIVSRSVPRASTLSVMTMPTTTSYGADILLIVVACKSTTAGQTSVGG